LPAHDSGLPACRIKFNLPPPARTPLGSRAFRDSSPKFVQEAFQLHSCRKFDSRAHAGAFRL